MKRIVLIISLLVAAQGVAQDEEAVPEESAAAIEEEVQIEESEPAEEFDETGLDEQGFEDDDDDFRPSEEIPTDQSIPFPTDI